eukprot:CAMPEP_0197623318 /NCGR_PEP_ID=MMETSP1338-20131121/3359_1 /TAXON_ID=43686 ORGANISM="Pelagodinium beii, Strain RCC1491" /NCGR_SAMPLE_ID=MMETSP1338 /ASSEMBLY_ACC=CAM_ASM_000754 /LENGTH=530 /DNA_ID=CAMNT_0043193255 /DNA_START=96 /DNA_END=1688 /DNA_ORIENTATION=-
MHGVPLALIFSWCVITCVATADSARKHLKHRHHHRHQKADKLAVEVHPCGVAHDETIERSEADSSKNELTEEKPWWPHMRGPVPLQQATTNAILPHRFGEQEDWAWKHPQGQYATVIAGGPLIDAKGNIYIGTHDSIRKFSTDGTTLWTYQTPGDMNNAPFLMDGMVLANTNNGMAFALKQGTGEVLWTKQVANTTGFDTGYPAGHDGIYLMAADKGSGYRVEGGNLRVLAMEASTGTILWSYRLQTPVWNFMPIFPGDDSVMFMDWTGSAFKLHYKTGAEIWKAMSDPDSASSYSNGGLTIGPSKLAYTCSNAGTSMGQEGGIGLLRALSMVDGSEKWRQRLPQPCNSQALVGSLTEKNLSVMVNIGALYGNPFHDPMPKHSGAMAFDASTGKLQWKYQAPVWHSAAAKGDLEGLSTRYKHAPKHLFCLPAPWSAPVLAYDTEEKGIIYMGHGDGNLYVLRGAPQRFYEQDWEAPQDVDFSTTEGIEVTNIDLSSGFLHGAAALAPGKLAVASCDTLHVFRVPEVLKPR